MRFLLPLMLVLASCAPPIETRYLPPPAEMGGADGMCAVQCEITQRQCISAAQSSVGACFGADAVMARGFNAAGRAVASGVEAPICLADRMACQAGFNACWQDCGGVVQQVRTDGRVRETGPTTPFIVPPLPGAARQRSMPAAERQTSMPAAERQSPAPAQRLRIRRQDMQRDGLL